MRLMTLLPSYRDLPKVNDLAASWGLLGSGGPDYFGCLNLMTPEKLVAAAQRVTRGAAFALNWSADLPDPAMFGRLKHTHEVLDRATGHDDVLHRWNTQSSSQWDGFRHVKNVPNGLYDGIPDIALLVVRGLPAWLYRGQLESRRDVVVAGLLPATSLPFIVTLTMIGVEVEALTAAVAAAFVGAGLLSAVIFPVVALTLAGRNEVELSNTAVA